MRRAPKIGRSQHQSRRGDRAGGRLPVRTNRFGNAFEQPFATDDGGRITYAYDLAGKLSRKAASGTFHVNVTRTDAGGATVLTCDSGRVTWKGITG